MGQSDDAAGAAVKSSSAISTARTADMAWHRARTSPNHPGQPLDQPYILTAAANSLHFSAMVSALTIIRSSPQYSAGRLGAFARKFVYNRLNLAQRLCRPLRHQSESPFLHSEAWVGEGSFAKLGHQCQTLFGRQLVCVRLH